MNNVEDEEKGQVKSYTLYGGFLLICGFVILFTSLSIPGASVNIFSGALILLIGILSLSNPYITYDREGFKKKNLLGMTLKTYTFSQDQIKVKDQKVYVNERKVRLGKSILKKSEYQRFIDHLLSHQDESSVAQSKQNDELLDSEI